MAGGALRARVEPRLAQVIGTACARQHPDGLAVRAERLGEGVAAAIAVIPADEGVRWIRHLRAARALDAHALPRVGIHVVAGVAILAARRTHHRGRRPSAEAEVHHGDLVALHRQANDSSARVQDHVRHGKDVGARAHPRERSVEVGVSRLAREDYAGSGQVAAHRVAHEHQVGAGDHGANRPAQLFDARFLVQASQAELVADDACIDAAGDPHAVAHDAEAARALGHRLRIRRRRVTEDGEHGALRQIGQLHHVGRGSQVGAINHANVQVVLVARSKRARQAHYKDTPSKSVFHGCPSFSSI